MTTPFDLAWMQPKVRQYLQACGTPKTVITTDLEPWLEACTDRPRIHPRRWTLCLGCSLQALGYRRRSHRGKVWDRVDPAPLSPHLAASGVRVG